MDDLGERLEILDDVPVPDLLPAIRTGHPSMPNEPSWPRRLAVAGLALLVAAGGFYVVLRAFGNHPARPANGGHPLEVSATTTDGSLQCFARLPSSVVQPGQMTGVSLTLTNMSNRPITRAPGPADGTIVISDTGGHMLWSGLAALSRYIGGEFVPPALQPGQSAGLRVLDTPVRWSGSLAIRATCLANVAIQLPPLYVRVAVPGPAPSVSDGLGRVIDRSGGLFDRCRPAPDGSWTMGSIVPPGGSTDTPSLEVRCSAQVEEHPGFLLITLQIVSPPNAPFVQSSDDLSWMDLPGKGSIEVTRWAFVVTKDDVREVVHLESVSRTRKNEKVVPPTFDFRNGAWSPGATSCGGGASGTGIWFISVCPP